MICLLATKGMYYQDRDSFFTDDMDHKNAVRGNGKDLMEKYDHPVWKEFNESGVKGGHGGADWLVLSVFFESVKNRTSPPIDVCDSAAWKSITTLSEQSIAMGSMHVYVPDFTNGKWVEREPVSKGKYCIDEI